MPRKINLILTILPIFTVLTFFSLVNRGKSQDLLTITPQEVKTKLDSTKELIIIDVRSEMEFRGELGHIPGTVLHPLPEIDNWVLEFSDRKNQEIILVCRSGNRSARAARYLIEHGFTNVKNMTGGTLQWNLNKYPIEK